MCPADTLGSLTPVARNLKHTRLYSALNTISQGNTAAKARFLRTKVMGLWLLAVHHVRASLWLQVKL